MTRDPQNIIHRGGNVVVQQANRAEKPRLRKGPHAGNMGFSRGINVPMCKQHPQRLSRYDSCIASDQSLVSGGVRA